MRVRKAVFPVAGMGTRMLPATKAIPKEMLPLVDRPLIQVVVEEAVAAGIEQIVLVTAGAKAAIEDHFDTAPLLEHVLAAEGKRDLLAEVRRPTELAIVVSVRQHAPRGLADAVHAAWPVVGAEPFMVFLPDDVVHSTTPCARQLLDVATQYQAGVIALERVPRAETGRYGIVTTEHVGGRIHRILDLVEKPDPAEAPSNLAIIGRYVLPPEVFPLVERTPPGRGGEIQLPDTLRLLLAEQPLYGYEFEGRRFDCGHPLGYLQAIVATALARSDLAPEFGASLRQLLAESPSVPDGEPPRLQRARVGAVEVAARTP